MPFISINYQILANDIVKALEFDTCIDVVGNITILAWCGVYKQIDAIEAKNCYKPMGQDI